MSHLHFNGLWSPALSVLTGLAFAGVAWWLYQKELHSQTAPGAKWLPLLRAAAIFLIIQMLSGPVIKYRETLGRLTRMVILVDGSRSMELTDPDMERARKTAIASQLRNMPDSGSQEAVFDGMSRTERARAVLFEGGSESLVSELLENFEVELISMEDSRSRRIWSSKEEGSAIPTALPPAHNERTDLATALRKESERSAVVSSASSQQRTVLVVLSDGNHNTEASPLNVAKQLGDSGTPIFCVGFGATIRPPDLAVQKIEAPDSVFRTDRIKGQVILKDDMPSGIPFELVITNAGTLAWEQRLITNGQHMRAINFDFAVQALLPPAADSATATGNAQTKLRLEAAIAPLTFERQTMNNKSQRTVHVVSSKRKMLILEGRPRWETRYIRNLFERDPQWDVNSLFFEAMLPGDVLPRGSAKGSFPGSRNSLMEYDVLVIGEWDASVLSDEELEWLSAFVSTRGGGVLLIDGERNRLKTLLGRPAAPLLPISFNSLKDSASDYAPFERLTLSTRAKNLPALSLAPGTAPQSAAWDKLQAPHWMADCTPLPGSEVLVEAAQGKISKPALVHSRYGAGKILYCASDETWRWRNNVAGIFQERFWSQIVTWIAAQPFAVQTAEVSLDTGGFVFKEGSTVELRVFIDPKHEPAPTRSFGASALSGVLWRNGNRIASIPLTSDDSRDGIFLGKSASLEHGQYEFTVEGGSMKDGANQARAQFEVLSEAPNELTEISQNESLLRQIAGESGGQYLPEESIRTLKDLLAPWKDGQSREVEIPIWNGFPWFSLLILLLGLEWWLRKRVGLI